MFKNTTKHRPKAVFVAIFETAYDVYYTTYVQMKKRFEVSLVLVPSNDNRIRSDINHISSKLSKLFKEEISIIHSVKELKKLKPDVVFYHTPYDIHIERVLPSEKVSIFTKIVYIPYGIGIMDFYTYYYAFPHFKNYWKICFGSSIDLKMASDFLGDKFISFLDKMLISGSPKLDFIDSLQNKEKFNAEDNNVDHLWPNPKSQCKKRIIWAPHWILRNKQTCFKSTSTFLKYYQFFLELAQRYSEKIDIVFRPHPLLYNTLVEQNKMTQKELQEFKKKFSSLPNVKIFDLQDGSYFNLCFSSDALITDGVSLFTEYPVNKPLLYTVTSKPCQFNEVGYKLINGFYKAENHKKIENFIKDVINNKDPDKEKRIKNFSEVIIKRKGGNAKFISIYILQHMRTSTKLYKRVRSLLQKLFILPFYPKEKRFWIKSSWDYSKMMPDRHKKQLELLQNFYKFIKPDSKVLDLACNDCSYAIDLMENAPTTEVHAVDLSPIAIKTASANISKLGYQKNFTLFNCSVEQFMSTEDPKQYDHIMMLGLLTCICDESLCRKIIDFCLKKQKMAVMS